MRRMRHGKGQCGEQVPGLRQAQRQEKGQAVSPWCWWVYLVRCRDGSLYCGIAKSVEDRVRTHNEGKGSKYTRSRRPVNLVWRLGPLVRNYALSLEYRIKQMPKAKKELLTKRRGGLP